MAHAEIITLWQDDGNGHDVADYFSSHYKGLHENSSGTIIADPTNQLHGAVHSINMGGTGTGSTEWGALRVDTSTHLLSYETVWSDRIVPGQTHYKFTADIYIPTDSTMRADDVVYLLIRFYEANGEFSDGNFINAVSPQYQMGDSGSWISVELEGVIPAVNASGNPVAVMQPIIPFSDFENDAADGVFVYIDNVKLTIDIPPSPELPPHSLVLNPKAMDLDNDGLGDIWESIHGAENLSALLDSDGDGMSNIDEAQALTDPLDANSRLGLALRAQLDGGMRLAWRDVALRENQVQTTTELGSLSSWTDIELDATLLDGEHLADLETSDARRFYRVIPNEDDSDADGLPDWLEAHLRFQVSQGNSTLSSKSYDTDGDGITDSTLSGDLAAFNEIYARTDDSVQMTEAQASRFLLQSTFGPTYEDIHYLKKIGVDAWLEEQMSLPKTFTEPYMLAINNDFSAGRVDPELSGYAGATFVLGLNYTTSWSRAVISSQDQLRQRVAWALSQILVVSRNSTGLANQGRSIANYYDYFIEEAFGSYEDLLNKVSRHPFMGQYLSSFRNQKGDPSLDRHPDENYAREFMQLFTIGLWELNIDGSRKLDAEGEPIPTYGNLEVTELARVFTGLSYDANSFNSGWRDDGYAGFMTSPMNVFPEEHDFAAKTLVTGHVIPARNATQNNGILDIEDAIYHIVRHPNTAPFVCRQLIQFLVTSNPTPGFVQRVAQVFQDNGQGVVGDLSAVIETILKDPEARDPLNHLGTEHFGHLREPTIRTMHLARTMKLGRFPNLLWWDWGEYAGASLQDPMGSPSVFNFFRPSFRMSGELAGKKLDSPVFEITDSYAAISYPNYLWKVTLSGFRLTYDEVLYQFSPDWSDFLPLADNVTALIDRVSLLYCGGTLSAGSRDIFETVLNSTNDSTERVQLAVYLALISPEGACLK